MDIGELATYALTFFERLPRREGEMIWHLKERYPTWVQEMVYKAHENMGADDYKYEFVVKTLDELSEGADPEEGKDNLEADIYTADLLQWLGSHLERTGFVDEIVEQIGHSQSGIVGDIMYGQIQEKHQVWDSVVQSLRDRLDDIDAGIKEEFERKGKRERGIRDWRPRG